jgi:hypothetical protein
MQLRQIQHRAASDAARDRALAAQHRRGASIGGQCFSVPARVSGCGCSEHPPTVGAAGSCASCAPQITAIQRSAVASIEQARALTAFLLQVLELVASAIAQVDPEFAGMLVAEVNQQLASSRAYSARVGALPRAQRIRPAGTPPPRPPDRINAVKPLVLKSRAITVTPAPRPRTINIPPTGPASAAPAPSAPCPSCAAEIQATRAALTTQLAASSAEQGFLMEVIELAVGAYGAIDPEGGAMLVAELNAALAAAPQPQIGDFGTDFARVVAQVDRVVDEQVWNRIKDVVPYGQVIDQAHQTRMRLLEQHAPEYYGPGSPGAASRPSAARPQTPPKTSTAMARLPAPSRLPIDRELDGLRAIVARAQEGDPVAERAIEQTRQGAIAGDPSSRRRWKVIKLYQAEALGYA